MLVRKFEADTLDEALKLIKRDLGPEAIILKTLTKRGLKGALGKSKIEVTAAITERDYKDKKVVDKALDQNSKDRMGNLDAKDQKNIIKGYSKNQHNSRQLDNAYGQLGLNKTALTGNLEGASSVMNTKSQMKESLDDFLGVSQNYLKSSENLSASSGKNSISLNEDSNELFDDYRSQFKNNEQSDFSESMDNSYFESKQSSFEDDSTHHADSLSDTNESIYSVNHNKEKDTSIKIDHRFDHIEKNIFELQKNFERVFEKTPLGLIELRSILKGIGIDEIIISRIIKKALFEFRPLELENSDNLIEFTIRELGSYIQVKTPSFYANIKGKSSFSNNQSENGDKTPIVIMMGKTSSGLTSSVLKLASLFTNAKIIQFDSHVKNKSETLNSFEYRKSLMLPIDDKQHIKGPDEHLLNFLKTSYVRVQNTVELVQNIRINVEKECPVIVDLKVGPDSYEDMVKTLSGLRRSFEGVETILNLSAIQAEQFNHKFLSQFSKLASGIFLTHMDLSVNPGMIVNMGHYFPNIPLNFVGNGEVIPKDFDLASKEKIMGDLFHLN